MYSRKSAGTRMEKIGLGVLDEVAGLTAEGLSERLYKT